MYFADVDRGRPFAKDPAVVRFRDRYLMYYSIPPHIDAEKGATWAIGIAESRDLANWTKVGKLLPADACEAKGLCAPGAIVLDGKVHLFYQSYGNWVEDAICHAVSEDGVHFTRNPTNPIFRPRGDWTCGRAIDADVIVYENKLWLYYATRDPQMKRQMLGVAVAPVGSDFSREDWVQLGNGSILEPSLPWEKDCIEAPAVLERNGRLWMFYAGAYNNEPQQIGCAVSDDGVHWERISEEPVLPNGAPGTWNESESGHPFVFVDDDGTVYLFFQGNNDGGKTWYLSKATVEWEGELPVIRPDLDRRSAETPVAGAL